MSGSWGDSPKVRDNWAAWDKWARGESGNSAAQARAAAEAAFRAAYHGAKQPEAVASGRAAAASVGAGAPPPGHQQFPGGGQYQYPGIGRVSAAPAGAVATEMARPARSGSIVGYVERYRPQQQLGSGLQIIVFELEPRDAPGVTVHVRGMLLDGVISDGDVVEVQNNGLLADSCRQIWSLTAAPILGTTRRTGCQRSVSSCWYYASVSRAAGM